MAAVRGARLNERLVSSGEGSIVAGAQAELNGRRSGFFGYVFGSAISGTGVGWIADHWGWGGVFTTMVGCCLLTIFFSALTLGHQARSEDRLTAESSSGAPG
jgi:sugar phosphate permease